MSQVGYLQESFLPDLNKTSIFLPYFPKNVQYQI